MMPHLQNFQRNNLKMNLNRQLRKYSTNDMQIKDTWKDRVAFGALLGSIFGLSISSDGCQDKQKILGKDIPCTVLLCSSCAVVCSLLALTAEVTVPIFVVYALTKN